MKAAWLRFYPALDCHSEWLPMVAKKLLFRPIPAILEGIAFWSTNRRFSQYLCGIYMVLTLDPRSKSD
jgi:hypothetical protein